MAVTFCGGDRCRAVRRLADERRPDGPSTLELLSDAVRNRRHSVLIRTACPGLCSHAAVVSVGWAIATGGSPSMTFVGRPITLEQTEVPGRAEAVAAWVRGEAPDIDGLAALLHDQSP